jgi:hypothetical protein
MPRGNDPDAAAELKARYNVSGNAEQLIQSNRARTNRVLAAAQVQAPDDEASKKLDLSKIDAPGDVVAAKVRGKYVSFVYEGADGSLHNGAYALPDAKGVVRESEQERAEREELERQTKVHRALREAAEQADRERDEAVRKAEAQAAEEAQKAQEQAEKQARKDAEQSRKDADKD